MKNILISGASSGLGRSLFETLQNRYLNANFYLISSQAKSKKFDFKFFFSFFSMFIFSKKIKKKQINIINISTFYAKIFTMKKKNFLNLFNENKFSPTKSYALSKLFLIIMANYLRKKYPKNCKIFNVDPGIIRTSYQKDTNIFNKTSSKIIRSFLGKDPNYVAEELINTIEKKNSFINSKYNYERNKNIDPILTDSIIQDKIFKISYEIYKKEIKNI